MFPDRKNLSPRINLYRTDSGVFGLYPEYPIIEELKLAAPIIRTAEGIKKRGNSRYLFNLDLDTPDGQLPLIVKPKTPNYEEEFRHYLSRFESVRKSREQLKSVPADSLLGRELRYHINLFYESIRHTSAVREVTMARFAAIEYAAHYGEDLSAEKPVGFYMDRRGKKWSFFERITDEIDESKLTDQRRTQIKKDGLKFVDAMYEKLMVVGIDAKDLWRQGFRNVMVCGEPDNPRFVIIDSEDWERIHEVKAQDTLLLPGQ